MEIGIGYGSNVLTEMPVELPALAQTGQREVLNLALRNTARA